jgi:hypothetical protein
MFWPMDKNQKAGLKLVFIAAAGLLLCFGLPLTTTLNRHGFLLALGGAFLCPFALIFGVFMLRFGSAADAVLGPLGSELRRRKVRLYGLLCAVPALGMCALLYFLLSQHGYQLIR